MKILFMGTPDFAAAALKALVKSRHEVAAVVTQPDKPKGRGHKMTPPEVKVTAIEYGIPVYQPERVKNGELTEILETVKPDITVVAAYGKIIPEDALNYAKYGAVNIHASLLPKLRGAAPIQWAVINGDKKTGITTMQMNAGLDTGDMLLKEETEIGEYETAEELFDRLAAMGADLILKTLDKLEKGEIIPEKQNESEHTYAPQIKKEDAHIDWSRSAREVSKLVCGMNSWPLAYTYYKNEAVKIINGEWTENTTEKCPGAVMGLVKGKGLEVACGEGTYIIKTVKFPGGKKMNIEDYIRGHEFDFSEIFS